MKNLNMLSLVATSALCSMSTDPNVALGGSLDPAVTLGAGGGTPSLAPAPVTLGAADPAPAPAPTDAPAADPNVFSFLIPNTETNIGINIATIPPETRLDILQAGIRDYIRNSVNQANVRNNKANAPFDAYDEAMKANPLQEAVKKPDGERATVNLLEVAAAARERLYKGEVKKQGDGTSTRSRTPVDPLVKMVTDAVTRELFEKGKAAGSKAKYMEVQAEVTKAGGGIAYLDAKIAEKVAATPEANRADVAKQLEAFKQDRYIKPAEMMLGRKDNKNTKEVNLFG